MLQADDQGLIPGRDRDFFLFTTQHPIQWVSGLFPWGAKQQVCEADNSPPCNAEVKNA